VAAGQAVLNSSWDVAAVRAVEDRLERRGVDAGRVHAATLRDVLELHTQHLRAGMSLMTETMVAQLLRVSEWKAGRLLSQALGLAELPRAFEALEWGLLQVDQCQTVVTQLAPLTPPQRLQLWERLLERLGADARVGAVLPPARLGELLKGWVIALAAQDAVERRKAAEQDRTVVYRKREDGLADLFLIGIKPTDAQAVLQRIRDASAPVGGWDDRTADQRRLDAAVDLLLGRHPLGDGHPAGGCAAGCGCLPGQAAPCGAQLNVPVPIGAALGTTDEVATLTGHGPIEPDLLQALLLNAPVLRAVFVDEHGTPVGVSTQTFTPERGDPASVRNALLRLGNLQPDRLFPIHPDDHPPEAGPPDARPPDDPSSDDFLIRAVTRAHPVARPGPYRVSGLLRRLVFLRAPMCEFPGCGARAIRCDAEHDLAWPDGPTCSCNLGPCCRRHHRIKQLGWTKTRNPDGSVTWTDPTGRTWLRRAQHQPPQPAARDLTPIPGPHPWDELNPHDHDHELWILAGRPEDPLAYELRATDLEPEDVPPPQHDHTRWTWDLDDPYAWLPELTTAEQ
jgi:hypothetical protein